MSDTKQAPTGWLVGSGSYWDLQDLDGKIIASFTSWDDAVRYVQDKDASADI